jgi:predicted Fe-Mo cluster-binding NifX family protein
MKGGTTMPEEFRIAIPTSGEGGLDAERSAHFGHADSFTVIDVADGVIVGGGTMVNPPHESGGCGRTVGMLASQGVNAAIVIGMGGGPLNAMNAHGMLALVDAEAPTPRAAVEAFIAGRRTPFGSDNLCKH